MSNTVLIKSYPEIAVNRKEILRYSGCKDIDKDVLCLLDGCINEVKDKLVYKVCYLKMNVTVNGTECDFGYFKASSKELAKILENCSSVILFAATIGVEIDRLISRYGKVSAAKAVIIDAIGSEQIETLCETFCNELKGEDGINLKNRFSPGYGDLPLSVQKDIFKVLDCTKHIGLALNDSLLMSPSKSVTAFVGVSQDNKEKITNKCSGCKNTECLYRGAK